MEMNVKTEIKRDMSWVVKYLFEYTNSKLVTTMEDFINDCFCVDMNPYRRRMDLEEHIYRETLLTTTGQWKPYVPT